MSDRPQMVFAFPRPGPALKVVLVMLAAVWLVGAIVFNWIPGGERVFLWLACTTEGVQHLELWRLLTAGLLTKPGGPGAISHLLFTLVGLYFLSPDLERRWGSARFARFLATCVVVGYAMAVGLDLVAHARASVFHQSIMFGAGAAITGTAVAWARENAEAEVRLFFVLPVKGKYLFWFTVAYCVLGVISGDTFTEGAVAPFGGIVVGLLLGGSPSAIRTLYLRTKLAMLRKQSTAATVRAALPRTSRRARGGSPPLRVVHGGLEEELKKREPPKDKRYLN
jgi:membrane associated rhomboid family serine protease